MNSKMLVGIVILVAVAGGVLLVSKSSNKQPPPQPIKQESQPTGTATPTNQEETNGTTVTISSSGFSPSTLTVKVGTKVTWVNKSGTIANISSVPHPVHTSYPPLNLGNFNDGESVSLVFDKTGTYGYHNHLNPSQTGTVVVE